MRPILKSGRTTSADAEPGWGPLPLGHDSSAIEAVDAAASSQSQVLPERRARIGPAEETPLGQSRDQIFEKQPEGFRGSAR